MLPRQIPDKYSDYENSVPQNSFYDKRPNSGYHGNIKLAQKVQTQERMDSGFGFETYCGFEDEYLPLSEPNQVYNQNARIPQNQHRRSSFLNQPPLLPEREEPRFSMEKPQGFKKENLIRNDYSREREKNALKENKYRLNQGSKSPSPSPLQSNSGNAWGGLVTKSNGDNLNEKVKSKAQNYKKYSELFRRQKEAAEQGNK